VNGMLMPTIGRRVPPKDQVNDSCLSACS
jgi:hypothetical protein